MQNFFPSMSVYIYILFLILNDNNKIGNNNNVNMYYARLFLDTKFS